MAVRLLDGVLLLALDHHRHKSKSLGKVPRQRSGSWSRRTSASATRWSPPRGAGTCLLVRLSEDLSSTSPGVQQLGYLMERNRASAIHSQGLVLWSTKTARGGHTNKSFLNLHMAKPT